MYRVEVLISCMFKDDISLIEKSNLYHDVIMVNQCDVPNETIYEYNNGIKKIDTPSRGLSVSRNTAVKYATADVCVLSDDDELFRNDAQEKISEAYKENPNADIIIFKIDNVQKRVWKKTKRLYYWDTLKVGSWQISFKRDSIVKAGIDFDINMGSGTGNGGGEENKFLIDCLKKGLKIYFVPVTIATMNNNDKKSQWFNGFDEKYFYTRGASTRYMLGFPISVIYALYYVIRKRPKYIGTISTKDAWNNIIKGIVDNRIAKGRNR